MKAARDENYYLSLTRTTDSAKLPPYLTFMSETNEITEAIFTSEFSDVIQDSENVLDFIAVTDQQIERPRSLEEISSHPRIVVSLKFPKSTKDQEASVRIVNAAINLVDIIATRPAWRVEVAKKIRATRENETKKVQKVLDEMKADKLALKKVELKREQQKNIAKLSPAEQSKAEQKEREKEQKRLRKRQSKGPTVRA